MQYDIQTPLPKRSQGPITQVVKNHKNALAAYQLTHSHARGDVKNINYLLIKTIDESNYENDKIY